MPCCMIRNTVKTMPYFYEIVGNYDYLQPFINTKTAIKNDLQKSCNKAYKPNLTHNKNN